MISAQSVEKRTLCSLPLLPPVSQLATSACYAGHSTVNHACCGCSGQVWVIFFRVTRPLTTVNVTPFPHGDLDRAALRKGARLGLMHRSKLGALGPDQGMNIARPVAKKLQNAA